MASTTTDFDLDFERINAREEHYARAGPSPPKVHKRMDSTDVGGVGTHFNPPTNQNSWPPDIDIPVDEAISTQYGARHHMQEQSRAPEDGPSLVDGSRDAPPIPSPPALPRDTHHVSNKDAALLRIRRDELRARELAQDQQSESSAPSCCGSPPSITEDDDLPGTHTPTPSRNGDRTPINASRPTTPTNPSVATTVSGYESEGKGPVSPDPWTATTGCKRKWSGEHDIEHSRR
ncbi:hypothetical protein CC86DRAFT_87758 [Ophiobolus disseminans]|uniref:Uncharacterized protein n=1 Tax=Ophiobolus disseminans TaxID=1469910 RepID=A0A6A7AI30_9PLEO|nr:hypothetical protein CC86DRAFT_87758 [Ophiobolus disseminans]